MPSQLLDMSDCESSEFSRIYGEISRIADRLQPVWFRPFFKIQTLRHKLGFDHWSRKWEYLWTVINADLRAGMRVLDIGSGSSPFPLYLGMKGYECYGADPSLDQGKCKKNWHCQRTEADPRRLLDAMARGRKSSKLRLLDVGCGNGYFIENSLQKIRDVTQYGRE
jgi:2-polyprenyl-3-methyl-5-hydroxy-6-metoxy-1,4-benzoquinol methylase